MRWIGLRTADGGAVGCILIEYVDGRGWPACCSVVGEGRMGAKKIEDGDFSVGGEKGCSGHVGVGVLRSTSCEWSRGVWCRPL